MNLFDNVCRGERWNRIRRGAAKNNMIISTVASPKAVCSNCTVTLFVLRDFEGRPLWFRQTSDDKVNCAGFRPAENPERVRQPAIGVRLFSSRTHRARSSFHAVFEAGMTIWPSSSPMPSEGCPHSRYRLSRTTPAPHPAPNHAGLRLPFPLVVIMRTAAKRD